jgi:glucokinase
MLLAGDIGGTKTRLAVVDPEVGLRRPIAGATLPSGSFPSLEALIGSFLSGVEDGITHACFGVAGPVVAGRATITNLPWVMDERELAKALDVRVVRLLNDLESIAYAIPRLERDDLYMLNEGQATPKGAIAVIAPGTGLGEAFLTWQKDRYCAHPSEGGHADFAPTDALELGLLRYLWDRYEHVSYERVCSGLGLPNIYAYLKASGYAEEPVWLADRLAQARDATPVIVNNALDKDERCTLCEGTLRTFVSILGAEAGNLALKTLATGGVYLGGGIPPRILPELDRAIFLRSFCAKGRFEALMNKMPVYVILNPQAPLLGAAAYGLEAGPQKNR